MKKNKNLLIILLLLFVVILMSIGYALYSTNLKIEGTGNISTNWDIEVTGIEEI
jgi:hypothetical protein